MLVKHKSDTTSPTKQGFNTMHCFSRNLGNSTDLSNVNLDVIKCYTSDSESFKSKILNEKKLAEIKTLLI